MDTIAYIFARGGSKGLPNKNIKEMNGKPLIAWAIECAMEIAQIGEVIVSTDSPEIAEISCHYGASVPFLRPAELAQDDSPEWLSWQHALKSTCEIYGKLPERMISLPPTAPLRDVRDIEGVINQMDTNLYDTVITVADAYRNPFFNMVKVKEDGTVGLVINSEDQISRRQDAPKIFDITTVAYISSSKFVLAHNHFFEGRVGYYEVPVERSIDIDTPHDFEVANFLMIKKNY